MSVDVEGARVDETAHESILVGNVSDAVQRDGPGNTAALHPVQCVAAPHTVHRSLRRCDTTEYKNIIQYSGNKSEAICSHVCIYRESGNEEKL